MNLKPILGALAISALFATPAAALTIVNDDEVTYTLDVNLGEGDSNKQQYELPFDHLLEDICDAGCTIQLNNGAQMEFTGHEYVTIKDGTFVIAE